MPFISADGAQLHHREAGHPAFLEQPQDTSAATSAFVLGT
jgi:hypothetical protein